MNRKSSRAIQFALAGAVIVMTVCGIVPGAASQADAQTRQTTAGDLFYNYYVPPVGPCSVGAELYLCPRPVPPWVGYTYITYQPLMPHEFLYQHSRVYYTSHEDAPPTKTTVRWRSSGFKVPPKYSLMPCSLYHMSGGNP
jgi:hypothetical protein